MSADGMKKRRPRVGDTRLITMIHVQAAGTVTHPDVRMVTITLMAVIVKGGGGYGNNRRPSYNNNRRSGGGGGFQRQQGYNISVPKTDQV